MPAGLVRSYRDGGRDRRGDPPLRERGDRAHRRSDRTRSGFVRRGHGARLAGRPAGRARHHRAQFPPRLPAGADAGAEEPRAGDPGAGGGGGNQGARRPARSRRSPCRRHRGRRCRWPRRARRRRRARGRDRQRPARRERPDPRRHRRRADPRRGGRKPRRPGAVDAAAGTGATEPRRSCCCASGGSPSCACSAGSRRSPMPAPTRSAGRARRAAARIA